MANAQAVGGAGALFVVITIGAAPIPTNTLVRLAVTVMANPAGVAKVGDLAVAVTDGVWVKTTKSGFRNGAAPAAGTIEAAGVCTNFCTPFLASTATVLGTAIFDAGAQINQRG
jgi:hypothetical protein